MFRVLEFFESFYFSGRSVSTIELISHEPTFCVVLLLGVIWLCASRGVTDHTLGPGRPPPTERLVHGSSQTIARRPDGHVTVML